MFLQASLIHWVSNFNAVWLLSAPVIINGTVWSLDPYFTMAHLVRFVIYLCWVWTNSKQSFWKLWLTAISLILARTELSDLNFFDHLTRPSSSEILWNEVHIILTFSSCFQLVSNCPRHRLSCPIKDSTEILSMFIYDDHLPIPHQDFNDVKMEFSCEFIHRQWMHTTFQRGDFQILML